MSKIIKIIDGTEIHKVLEKHFKKIEQQISVDIEVKIKDKVEEYQKKTGITKAFIADKLGISRQALSEAFKSNNPRLETLIKFAICLDCKVEDLYEYSQTSGFKNNSDIPEK